MSRQFSCHNARFNNGDANLVTRYFLSEGIRKSIHAKLGRVVHRAIGECKASSNREVIRASDRVRKGYERELLKLHGAIAAGLKVAHESEQRDLAWTILSLLTGGLMLARAVAHEDLAEDISRAVHQATVAIASGLASS